MIYLLLYFRMNYEKGKLKILLSKKELCQYYAEKINFNEKFYPLVALAEEDFINKIMEQKKLSFEIIKEIIFSYNSFEKNISFIDKNYDKIKEICKKEECHRMVRGNSQRNILFQDKAKNFFQSPTDKLRKIIEDIIKKLGKRKYLFILFDEKFWNNYLNEKIKIFLIDESIIICQKFDKKFEAFKQEENKMVSKLNNQDLLVFLENDLLNYDNRKYEIYYCTLNYLFLNNSFENERKKNITEYFKTYKPLSLLDKININDLDVEFFKKWDTIKNGIFKLKNKRYILNSKDIVSKIKDMDDFENVLKLFFTKGVYNDDINYYEKDLIMLLSEAFIILITTNKTYNNIPQNASFVINLLIKINENKEKKNYDLDIRKGFNLLMKQIEENKKYYPLSYIETIEDIISDKKNFNEILICLSSNYRISNEIINHIADYIFKRKEISIIKKLNQIQKTLVTMLLFKIDKYIKEKMLFDNEKINDFFQLLNDIEKEKLIQDYSSYKNYLNNIPIILDNIKNGKVSFKIINSIFSNFNNKQEGPKPKEKKIEIFKLKLSILLFNQDNELKLYMNKINNYLDKIYKEQKYIQNTKEILKNFYNHKNDYDANIALLKKVLNKIEEGELSDIDNLSIKTELNKIHKTFPNFDKKYICQFSSYFKHKLNKNNNNDINAIDGIFKQVSEDFDALKILFEKNWELKIVKERCFKYYNIIKEEGKKQGKNILIEELTILKNYHGINISIKELQNIGDKIVIYILKQDNLKIINNNLDLILNEKSYNYKKFKEELIKMKEIISYKKEW